VTLTPDVIQAIGVAVAAVLTAWQANMWSKLRDLNARVKVVETERDQFKHLLRVSVQHIREWMSWATNHAPPGTPPPAVPPELRDEV